jgi:hypothetical protein
MAVYTTTEMKPLRRRNFSGVFHQFSGKLSFEKGAPKHIPITNAAEVRWIFVLSYALRISFLL